MKALLFYNQYSQPDLDLKAQVESQGLDVECVEIMDGDNPFKKYIRATPALIVIRDDMQGDFLNENDVDSLTYVTASLIDHQDKEEKIVHKQDNKRLDQHIKQKEKKARLDLLDEMVVSGVITVAVKKQVSDAEVSKSLNVEVPLEEV